MKHPLHSALHAATASKKAGARTASRSQQTKRPGGAGIFSRLADLYRRMESAYEESAASAGLTCAGCETNCCSSYFRHHTFIEWAYLWRGLSELSQDRRAAIVNRATEYVSQMEKDLSLGVVPSAMCPLNDDGLCSLYPYRLMICRMHGTRNVFTLPDGRVQSFSGCARFTSLPGIASSSSSSLESDGFVPLDRTPLYAELAALEMEFRQKAGTSLPGVSLTLAEMIVQGPPKFR